MMYVMLYDVCGIGKSKTQDTPYTILRQRGKTDQHPCMLRGREEIINNKGYSTVTVTLTVGVGTNISLGPKLTSTLT